MTDPIGWIESSTKLNADDIRILITAVLNADDIRILITAVARGARLEWKEISTWRDNNWRPASLSLLEHEHDLHEFRINPKDWPYRYGPISYEFFLKAESLFNNLLYFIPGLIDESPDYEIVITSHSPVGYYDADKDTQCFYWLFVAEDLMWKGL